jgi:hypothetical protein
MSLLSDYIESLESKGQFFFARQKVKEELKISDSAFNVMMYRLIKDKMVVSLNRKCCAIIPLQFREMGSPPAEWYLDEFMREMGLDYYVGLLTAADYYGSAHQAAQDYQVVVNKQLRPFSIGRTNLVFFYKRNFSEASSSLVSKNNRGINISSPALTAMDLLNYRAHALNSTATVIAELAKEINKENLILSMKKTSLGNVQRLGYILELSGYKDLSQVVKTFLNSKKLRYYPLQVGLPLKGEKERKWKLILNTVLEIDEI